MAFRSKTTLIALGIAATLLVATILIVPALMNLDRNRLKLISYLQERTGKQVEIGRLALTLFPLAIHIDDFDVRNPPPFPPGQVVKVARIEAEVDPRALLHRQIVIKSLVLDNPVIHLTSDPDGAWNFENSHARAPEKVFPLGVIAKVEIKQGQLVASNLLPSDAPGPVFFEAHDMSGEFVQVNVDAIINSSSTSAKKTCLAQSWSLKLRFSAFLATRATGLSAEVCQSYGPWRGRYACQPGLAPLSGSALTRQLLPKP